MKKNQGIITDILLFFAVCFAVHTIEVLLIRTDETFFAECFINKIFGTVLLFTALKKLGIGIRDIGMKKEAFAEGVAKGLGICAVSYALAFAAEFIYLSLRGTHAHLEFYVTGFSLTGDAVRHTGIGFVLMCIFFNIINVLMEEGVFRGFYITRLSEVYPPKTALIVSALLFGIWHLVTPLRILLDGEMSAASFAVMAVGYIILSMLMGIKWGLLYQNTGNIWIGMADHFFNNCAATNLLHTVTADGADEMQIIRVMTGELLSFFAVLIYTKIKNGKKGAVINENAA